MTATPSIVGAPIPRVDGPDKVTGKALYTADVILDGMLWGKILRSPYPHARIISIDASEAWKVPGVRAVVTGKDIPGHLQGRRMRDQPVLCWDKVRFAGDRVAAVAADTPEAAEEALQQIVVEYEELPPVFDLLEAMEPDAPRVHDDISIYEEAPSGANAIDIPNGLSYFSWKKGDVEEGFAKADRIIEHTFRLPSRHQGYIEPHACAVQIEPDGRVQVWQCTKNPFSTREQLAKAVGIEKEQVRVNVTQVGGDFGGKGDALDLPIAYFLAKRAGQPVKIVMSYTEELMAADPSHPTVITIRTGVTNDGHMVARTLRAIHSSGAYGSMKPTPGIGIGGASQGGGPYRIENTFFEAIQVYTNAAPSGFFRAPGATQANFAAESHTDLVARELGMDPAEFRMLNLLGEGDVSPLGERLRDVKARETLQAAMEAIGWNAPKPGPNYGRGIAMYERHVGAGMSGATLIAETNGTLTIVSPTFDQGVGTHTVLRQMVAQDMGLPLDQVRVTIGDTDTAPFDGGVGGARVTNSAGTAFLMATEQLRDQLRSEAAQLLECPLDAIQYDAGHFFCENNPNETIGLGEVVSATGGPVTVTTSTTVKPANDITCFTAQIVEAEVDPETGQVRLHRFVTAHDVGTIINPISHQGQIDGGVSQGIGVALMEEIVMEDGQVMNLNLGDYKLPTMADMPDLQTIHVHSAGGPAPFEAKAIGEMANPCPPAAIANAVADACGVRLFEVPITSEKVYRALQER